jgi:two-component sensor histidine kinase
MHFPEQIQRDKLSITIEVSGTDWELSVADNGVGKQDGVFAQPKTGLGSGIVKALAQSLNAKVETPSGIGGTTVSVTHATF